MRYRDYRGGLADSLNSLKRFSCLNELMNYLNREYSYLGGIVDEVQFKFIGLDEGFGWTSYYVLIRLQGQDGFSVVGISDMANFD